MKSVGLFFTMADGVSITADAWGNPDNPPVLLSHGGGQTRHAWGGTAKALAEQGWYTVAYDHRGHGDSSWSPDGRYSIELFAGDQQAIAQQLPRPPVLVGASLGGLSAMYVQGYSAEPIYQALILVDVTPNVREAGALSILDFMSTHVDEGFASLQEAADAVADYSGRPRRQQFQGLHKNLRLRENDRYYWHWDPAFLHSAGQPDTLKAVLEGDLMDVTRKISQPILLIRGSESDVVTEEIAAEFLRQVPHAECVAVEHARHMVAGDRNDIFTQAVTDFLKRMRIA